MKQIRRTTYFDEEGNRRPILVCDTYDEFLTDILRLKESGKPFRIQGRAIFDDMGQCIVNWPSPRGKREEGNNKLYFTVRLSQEMIDKYYAIAAETGMSMGEVVEWFVTHHTIPTHETIGTTEAFRLLHCADCGRGCSDAMMRNCGDFCKYVRDAAKREQTKQR